MLVTGMTASIVASGASTTLQTLHKNRLADSRDLVTTDLTWKLHCRILAPATYIFFASAIPALAFGQQISAATGPQGF